MIQKPYNINIKDQIIDASKSYLLKWQISGDISASFSISVYRNRDGVLAWNLQRTYSYATSYTIPANTLQNGIEYRMSITVWNELEQSAVSTAIVFTTSTPPTVTVGTIGTVKNHTYLFTATYSQYQGEPLQTYVVNLYDSSKKLLKTSGLKTDGLMEHRFDYLKNDAIYYIEFNVTSSKGLTGSSGLVQFNVVYDNPSIYFDIEAIPVPEKASVKIQLLFKQLTGKINIKPVYIDGTKLDVRKGKVFYDEGFEISGNFTLKLWIEYLRRDLDIIRLKGKNGEIHVQYKSDSRFHLYKTVNYFTTHYSTNVTDSSGHFLCIQQINGRMDMHTEPITASTISANSMTFGDAEDMSFGDFNNVTF